MKRVYTNSASQPTSGFWKQIGFHCCAVVFSAIFFFAYFNGWAHVPANEPQQDIHISSFPKAGNAFNNNHADPHPFSTNLVFVETEVVDTNQSKSECDTGLDDVSIPVPSSYLHTGKSLFLQLKSAHEGREQISLILLHHSWKSFLA